MLRLENKVIVVTGSCTGIGKAIARRSVTEGAQVIVHGLQQELGEALVKEFGRDKARLFIEDLTNTGCPERIVEFAVTEFGKLDAIVNNAALIATGTIHDTDAARFSEFLTINTLAPYLMIKAALPQLRKNRGCVLNIGSVNAYSGEPELLPYSVSKGALMTMTRNLGDTLMREDGVRVNQINPGWVLTEAEETRKRGEGFPDNWYADLPKVFAPAGRIVLPEEIAAAAVYWLADESGPISGQVVDLEQHPFIGRNPPKNESTFRKHH
jgi:NAD(P)-dependent dehydrogenase (short-subunit alcohol dehydrogenase family)